MDDIFDNLKSLTQEVVVQGITSMNTITKDHQASLT
jgi:hypothetical protein